VWNESVIGDEKIQKDQRKLDQLMWNNIIC